MTRRRDECDHRRPGSRDETKWLPKGFGALISTLLVFTPAVIFAQESAARAAEETSIHGGWLVIAAYVILWLGLFAYVGYLGVRQRTLDEQIDDLERRIERSLSDIREEE